MRDNKSLFFIVISISLLLLIIAWTGIRIYYVKKNNSQTAYNNFLELKQNIVTSYLARGSFSSDYFSRQVKQYVSNNSKLQAVVIYSAPGIRYLYAVNSSYITNYSQEEFNWNGIPQISVEPFFESSFNSSLTFPQREDLFITSIYNIVTSEDLFQVFRDTAIAFLGLIILIVVFMILLVPKKTTAKEESADQTDVGPAASQESAAGAQKPETPPPASGPQAESPAGAESTGKSSAESQGLFSPYSGLGWESYLENRLNFELRRSASFDQDLTLVLLSSPKLQKTDQKYREVADGIIDFFTFQDLTFEYGENGFSIILPNTELDQSIKKVEMFLSKLKSLVPEVVASFSVGMSSRNGRLLSAERIINEAVKALNKASRFEGMKIIGFRSDPVKYRKYIASQL